MAVLYSSQTVAAMVPRGYPKAVMATIPGATYYKVEDRPDKFASGRPKIDLVFSNCNGEICRRTGMRLTSKRTNQPYEVCKKFPGK